MEAEAEEGFEFVSTSEEVVEKEVQEFRRAGGQGHRQRSLTQEEKSGPDSQELLELKLKLEEKEHSILELAKIGQGLLAQKQEVEEENGALLAKVEALEHDLAESRHQFEELKEGIEIEWKRRDAQENEEMKALAVKCSLLEDQLKEAFNANKRILDELHEKDAQLEAQRQKLKDMASLNERIRILDDEVAELREKLQRTYQENSTLHRENSKLQLERQSSETTLEEKIKTVQKEMEVKAKTTATKSAVDGLKAQLQEAIEEIEAKEQQLSQSKWENKRLEQAMATLVRENQRLCDEKDEHLRVLDEARSTIASLRQDSEIGKLQHETEPQPLNLKELVPTDSPSLSKRVTPAVAQEPVPPPSPPPPVAPITPPQTSAPPSSVLEFGLINCEEYFLMAATGVKIGMALKHPHVSDKVFQINSRHLFQEAARLDIPFHEWHFWIVDRFSEKLKEYQLELARRGVMIGLKEEGGRPPLAAPPAHPHKAPAPKKAANPTGAAGPSTRPNPPSTSTPQQPQEEESTITNFWNFLTNKK